MTPGQGTRLREMVRYTSAVPLAVGLLFTATHAVAQQPATTRLEITSERLELDGPRNRAEFIGDVLAREGELTLRCDRLIAQYDDAGTATRVEARGRVRVSHGRVFATAGRAEYERSTEVVRLDASPVVWRGAQRVAGDAVRIYLKTERVEVDAPRGVIEMPTSALPGATRRDP